MSSPYIVFDIETTGPVPNPYSMLSLGAVALDGDSLEPIGEYYRRLKPMFDSEHRFDADTWDWWKGFPEQLAEAQREPINAVDAMEEFVGWAYRKSHGDRAVLLAKPATFDGMFLNHYLVTAGFKYENLPWKHRIMDLASFMVGRFGCDYHRHGKLLPKVEGHNHNALDDARVLAEQLRQLLRQPVPTP